jgi:hypothetical protein
MMDVNGRGKENNEKRRNMFLLSGQRISSDGSVYKEDIRKELEITYRHTNTIQT